MSKTEYCVVILESSDNEPRACLGSFSTDDWGGEAEAAARSLAARMAKWNPSLKLEIQVVFTKSEILRTINL